MIWVAFLIIQEICRVVDKMFDNYIYSCIVQTTDLSWQSHFSSLQDVFHSDTKHEAEFGSKGNGYDGSTQCDTEYTV
jgi:hypothetical protein